MGALKQKTINKFAFIFALLTSLGCKSPNNYIDLHSVNFSEEELKQVFESVTGKLEEDIPIE